MVDVSALAWQADGKAQLNTLAGESLGQDQALLIPPAGVPRDLKCAPLHCVCMGGQEVSIDGAKDAVVG
jgi:hypothetical protein